MIELNPLEETLILEKPKRLMKYVLIWCTSGSGKIVIDEGNTHTNSIRRNVSVTVDAKNAQMLQISNQKDFKTR